MFYKKERGTALFYVAVSLFYTAADEAVLGHNKEPARGHRFFDF